MANSINQGRAPSGCPLGRLHRRPAYETCPLILLRLRQAAEVVEAAGEAVVSETEATNGESVGVLSLDEQKKKRAERFGISVVETKAVPAGKPGTMDDKLKERAARFGLPVSGTAAGDEDNKAARNKRFGGVDASVEAEKKKARSERFGTSAETEAQQAKLDARAKRFASTPPSLPLPSPHPPTHSSAEARVSHTASKTHTHTALWDVGVPASGLCSSADHGREDACAKNPVRAKYGLIMGHMARRPGDDRRTGGGVRGQESGQSGPLR